MACYFLLKNTELNEGESVEGETKLNGICNFIIFRVYCTLLHLILHTFPSILHKVCNILHAKIGPATHRNMCVLNVRTSGPLLEF